MSIFPGVTGAEACAALKQAVLAEEIQRRWPDDADAIFEVEHKSPYSLAEVNRYIQRRISQGATVRLALRDVRAARRAARPLPRSIFAARRP